MTRRTTYHVIAVLATASCGTSAAVVLDGSLGPGGPLTGPNYIVPAESGQLRGANLFHSFGQFNVNAGESVTFYPPADGSPVTNIISRVTGGGPSNINGFVRSAVPGANFYLINPAGVIVGNGAQFQVQGSIALSTADYIKHADGAKFVASLGGQSTLSTASPAAFGFLNPHPAAITVNGPPAVPNAVSVPPGQVLSLVGGDIHIAGGQLQATGGKINLVSTASPGEASLNPADPDAPVDVSHFQQMGSIDLTANATVFATVGGGVLVRAGDLQVNASAIDASTDVINSRGVDIGLTGTLSVIDGRISGDTTGVGAGGLLRISADRVVVNGLPAIDGGEPITADAFSTGPAGGVSINVGDLTIAGGGAITALTHGTARGGDLHLTASRSITIDGTGSATLTGLAAETIGDSAGSAPAGRGGNITVSAPLLTILNSGEVTSTTKGTGQAGDILVNVGTFRVDGQNAPTLTGLQARVGNGPTDTGAAGAGGAITVNAQDVQLVDGGVITGSTFGHGAGGSVTVNTTTLEMSGPGNPFTGIFSRSTRGQTGGTGGGIVVNAQTISASNGAQISASTNGDANGGSVRLSAAGGLTLSGQASVAANATASGAGGDVQITAGAVQVLSGSQIAASTSGTGAGGAVQITANTLLVDGGGQTSTIQALTSAANGGNARDIRVAVHDLKLTNGGIITAVTRGAGNAGNVSVTADTIEIQGYATQGVSAGISADTTASVGGTGGDVTINTGSLSISGEGAVVTATTQGTGNAGKIGVTATGPVTIDSAGQSVNESGIIGNSGFPGKVTPSVTGSSGSITLVAGSLALTNGGQLVAQTFGSGAGGPISVDVHGPLTLSNHSQISASATGSGSGGDVKVHAAYAELSSGSSLSASSDGSGQGGGVQLKVDDSAYLSSQSHVESLAQSTGAAGTILVDATRLVSVAGGSDLSVSAKTTAGGLMVRARRVLITGNSLLSAQSDQTAGDVQVIAGELIRLRHATVTGSAGGDGGRVTLDPPVVILQNSVVDARSHGRAVAVDLPTDSFLSDNSAILTNTDRIFPTNVIAGSLVPLPPVLVESPLILQPQCGARFFGNVSSFIVTGRGGEQVRPGGLLPEIDSPETQKR